MSMMLTAYSGMGNEGFSQMITQVAPYFGTIDPTFVALKPGYSEVTFPNRKEVHNHLGTIHAVAMCNAAELVAGTMTDASLPEGKRWIPSGMAVKYLKKAKTDLRAVANGEAIDWQQGGEIIVPVSIFDTDNELVFTAEITMNIK